MQNDIPRHGLRPATVGVHGGYDDDASTGATAVPIFQTASYAYGTTRGLADVFRGRSPGHVYSRISNPTTYALERRLAQMEGGVGAIATASGMGAITAVMTALLRADDEIVSVRGIFGGTVSLFRNVLSRFNIRATLTVPDAASVSAAVTDATKVIFAETITNPVMDVPDLQALSEVARSHNIPLVVDATVTTPALARVKDFGADVIVHSTTKFINGHGTAIGGAIVDTGNYRWAEGRFEDLASLARKAGEMALLARLRNVVYRDLGACPAPQNSFLMLQGLETLSARMPIHCQNALRLAELLDSLPGVGWVSYPGLPSSPHKPVVDRLYGGVGGAILTFGLAGKADPSRCMDSLVLARRMTNLGDAKTLVLHPASTIFAEYDRPERLKLGVTDDMIRVSVGIEDFEDIRDDFEQAIAQSMEN